MVELTINMKKTKIMERSQENIQNIRINGKAIDEVNNLICLSQTIRIGKEIQTEDIQTKTKHSLTTLGKLRQI